MQRYICSIQKGWSLRFIQYRCKTYYDVLGVPENASKKEIRTAFLEKSKKLHPDQNKNDPKTHDKFVELNEAYTALSKTTRRADYDRSLKQGRPYGGDDLGYNPSSGPSQQQAHSEFKQNSRAWTYDNHDHRAAYEKYEEQMKRNQEFARQQQSQRKRRDPDPDFQKIGKITYLLIFGFILLALLIISISQSVKIRRYEKGMTYCLMEEYDRQEVPEGISEKSRQSNKREFTDKEFRERYMRARETAVRGRPQKPIQPKEEAQDENIHDSGRQFESDDAQEIPTIGS